MYRRKLMFLMILVLLMTGCVKITNDLDSVVETVISSRKTSTNTVSMGYELYIPTGVKQSFDSEYNQVLKVRNTNMYLYVDTISYYYKNMLNINQPIVMIIIIERLQITIKLVILASIKVIIICFMVK